MSSAPDAVHGKPRTVQEYIDERPMWPDGTHLPSVPMTAMQRRIWGLAAAGKFFEGFVVFMTGVAVPLIAREFQISPTEKGLVTAASLAGILVGALGLGGLSDYFGRKSMFIVEMIIFTAFLGATVFCASFPSLIFCLFGLGVALGCDYPTAHMIISENIPSTSRGKLVLAAFAFQAVGALGGALVGYTVLVAVPNLNAWRWMYATAVIPALLVTVGRFYITESANWLHTKGSTEKATHAARRLLVRTPQYPQHIVLAAKAGKGEGHGGGGSFISLFQKRYRRATILASVPWFLQDLGTYGIGIFTPTILATALGHKAEHVRSMSDLISNATLAARGDAMITVLLIIGICFAVMLADKLGRIRLQIAGFIGCAIGLFIASLSVDFTGGAKIALIFVGFMMFDFMTNLGPNAQTYLLAGEVFPTAVRGQGAGFAAAFAKIGAVATAFLFPILLATIGTRLLLYGLVVAFILGAIVTWFFRIETTGVSLDQMEELASAPVKAKAIA
ncbi:MAG TPA: MFS transporter [Terracidiphilus sp.]|nr:MFS transporter [Terracidiphilus sp.]